MSKGYAQHPEGGLGMKKAKDIHSAYEKLIDQFRTGQKIGRIFVP